MTGKAMQLKDMVEKCLEDEPEDRPAIREVSAIIKPLNVSINTYVAH